jgi:hypothetical protein
MKTYADIKRRLIVGTHLTMLNHDWYPNGKLIGVRREITTRKASEIGLKTDNRESYLRLDRPASDYTITGADTFKVLLNPDTGATMEYLIN